VVEELPLRQIFFDELDVQTKTYRYVKFAYTNPRDADAAIMGSRFV